MKFTETLLMTPGPVQIDHETMIAGASPLLHHRTTDFSPIYTECIDLLKKFMGVKGNLFMTTSSGTGAMETAIANLFNEGETVLNIVTGVFGVRFTQICQAFRLNTVVLKAEDGKRIEIEQIAQVLKEHPEITGVTVTFNETSTGVVNDIKAIGEFLADKNVMLVVDGVSAIGALPYNHEDYKVDCICTASQKGFLCPPGIGIVGLSDRAWEKAQTVKVHGVYFDLKYYKKNQDGAVPAYPWTPAINVQYSLLVSLRRIEKIGFDNYLKHYDRMASALRAALKALNLKIFTEEKALSNVLTVFYVPEGINPKEVIKEMVEKYGIRIAGGQEQYANCLLRVATIGNIAERDIISTIATFEMVLKEKGALKETGAGVKAAMDYFLNNK